MTYKHSLLRQITSFRFAITTNIIIYDGQCALALGKREIRYRCLHLYESTLRHMPKGKQRLFCFKQYVASFHSYFLLNYVHAYATYFVSSFFISKMTRITFLCSFHIGPFFISLRFYSTAWRDKKLPHNCLLKTCLHPFNCGVT